MGLAGRDERPSDMVRHITVFFFPFDGFRWLFPFTYAIRGIPKGPNDITCMYVGMWGERK